MASNLRWYTFPFDHNRYIFAFCLICFANMGGQFMVLIWKDQNPITPELYGPAVYTIPAAFWAGVQVVACTVGAVGCWIGGRTGAGFALVGSTVAFLMFTLFAVLAQEAELGTLVAIGSKAITAPMAGLVVLSALGRVIE